MSTRRTVWHQVAVERGARHTGDAGDLIERQIAFPHPIKKVSRGVLREGAFGTGFVTAATEWPGAAGRSSSPENERLRDNGTLTGWNCHCTPKMGSARPFRGMTLLRCCRLTRVHYQVLQALTSAQISDPGSPLPGDRRGYHTGHTLCPQLGT